MPKKPRPRKDYDSDAQYLLRLAHAVELDTRRSAGWRGIVIHLLQYLSTRLMEEPDDRETKTEAIETQVQTEEGEGTGKAQEVGETPKAKTSEATQAKVGGGYQTGVRE